MSERERIQKQRTERTTTTSSEVSVDATKGDQLKADLDDLLDEIDEVLEENAEEFVRNYVQKGGEEMGLPLFNASDDPGPSFFHFAQSTGLTPPVLSASATSAHATTVIAVRYQGGVVMVGDRQ